MAYGTDRPATYQRGAALVDRVLRGTKPAELPVERPTALTLVINLNREGARPDDPPWLLLRADQVIDVAERCNGADGRHVLLYHREIQPFDRDGRYLRSLTATE